MIRHSSFTIRNCLGFTIIELIVSIAIIGTMAGIFFANYHDGGIQTDLNGAVQKLASDIRLAQNFSLGTKEFGSITPKGGWGINFNKDSQEYFIFADDNGNYTYNESNNEKYNVIKMPANITISSLKVSDSIVFTEGNAVNSADIVFLPPDPQTYINASTNQNIQITVRENVNNTIGQIEVNFLGLIDVID